MRPPEPIPARVLLCYALPALVLAMPTIPVYIHLPSLYGVELGLGLAATGLLLLAARIFDTVTDPLVGALSDRFAFRGSRRKPWIAAGAIIAGLGLFRLLNPPADPGGAYLLVWSMTLYGGWTMIAVPYLAWGADLSADYDERTRITAWREGFMLAGILAAGALGALTGQLGWGETDSAGAIAWLAIALGIVVIPPLLRYVPDGPVPPAAVRGTGGRRHWREGLVRLAANRPFLRLLLAWFLNGLANGIPAALFLIYLEYGLGVSTTARPGFVLAYFMAAILAIPLWSRLSRRYGKHRVWCWAMLAACAAFAVVPAIPDGGLAAFAAVCIVTGATLGADLALPPAIQADVVDYDELRGGARRAGLQFAFWGMGTKLAMAAAVGLALPGLTALGFDPAAPTADARDALLVIYALLPVVIKLTAIAVVWRFPLTAGRQAAIRRRLERRRARRIIVEETA